ncbi:response regulator [Candidatus Woesearchaeota archaeon]|nr:response regulator [Candidatus Woesearchaeota archaeon]
MVKLPKILVVDDEPNFQNLVKIFLKDRYNVVCACNGMKAIEIAESEKPDLITMDIMMPGLDGISVMQQLKKNKKTKDIPIIFLTIVDKAQRAYELGAIDYLMKPFDQKDLLRSIDRALNNSNLS